MKPDSKLTPISMARKKSDTIVLIITILVVLGLAILSSSIEIGQIISTFIIVIIILLVSLFYISIYQSSLLGNSMRIQNSKHKELLNIVKEIEANLNISAIDIYITQDPYLNAYAIGYTSPFSIVINDAVIGRLNDKEIKAILLHEVGHILYHHTTINAYITPLSRIPIIGFGVTWLFGFWSRRAELACDRFATAYLRDPDTVINALIKVYAGSEMADKIGIEGVVYQDIKGRGLMRQIAQSTASHPFLVTRVKEITDLCLRYDIALPKALLRYLNMPEAK